MTRSDGPADAARSARSGPGSGRAAVGVAGVVLAASLVPVPGGGGAGGALPAWLSVTTPFHLVGYAVLGALAARAATASRPAVALAVGAGAAAAFGLGVEVAQAPVPWRSFAWTDAAVNAVGAALGAGAVALRRAASTDRPS